MEEAEGKKNDAHNCVLNACEIVDKLIKLTIEERDLTIKKQVDSLGDFAAKKAELIGQLKNISPNALGDNKELAEKLSQFRQHNEINMRLFQSILKLSSQYRKLLSKGSIEAGTYGKDGKVEKNQPSIIVDSTT